MHLLSSWTLAKQKEIQRAESQGRIREERTEAVLLVCPSNKLSLVDCKHIEYASVPYSSIWWQSATVKFIQVMV